MLKIPAMAHWVLATLADLGYPPGDKTLLPLRDQLLGAWLSPEYFAEFECASKAVAYGQGGVPRMLGRYRRCVANVSIRRAPGEPAVKRDAARRRFPDLAGFADP
jgi:hypothetical protein